MNTKLQDAKRLHSEAAQNESVEAALCHTIGAVGALIEHVEAMTPNLLYSGDPIAPLLAGKTPEQVAEAAEKAAARWDNPTPEGAASDLNDELRAAINRSSAENGSDTPDFILAEFLRGCLTAYNKAVTAREEWYGRAALPKPFPSTQPAEGAAEYRPITESDWPLREGDECRHKCWPQDEWQDAIRRNQDWRRPFSHWAMNGWQFRRPVTEQPEMTPETLGHKRGPQPLDRPPQQPPVEAWVEVLTYRQRIEELTDERDHWRKEYQILAFRLRCMWHPDDNGLLADGEVLPSELKARIAELEQQLSDASNHEYAGELRAAAERVKEVECKHILLTAEIIGLQTERDELRAKVSRANHEKEVFKAEARELRAKLAAQPRLTGRELWAEKRDDGGMSVSAERAYPSMSRWMEVAEGEKK